MNQAGRPLNGATPNTARQLLDETARIGGDLTKLAETGQRAVRGWQRYLRQRVDEQPYATVVVAAGLGYVLGGGLPVSLVRIAVGIGSRLAAERVLSGVARTLMDTPNKNS
ncbi:MAG: hypothetical protein ABI629_14065 [bacterium]